jgi:hypothetical protein
MLSGSDESRANSIAKRDTCRDSTLARSEYRKANAMVWRKSDYSSVARVATEFGVEIRYTGSVGVWRYGKGESVNFPGSTDAGRKRCGVALWFHPTTGFDGSQDLIIQDGKAESS